MTPEKVKAFQEFNWTDDRWQTKIKAYDIPPTRAQIPKQKKKWYRDNIDHEFDIEADLEEILKNQTQSNTNTQNTNGTQSSNTTENQPKKDLSGDKKFLLEGWLKFFFQIITFTNIPFPYNKLVTLVMGVAICYLGTARQSKSGVKMSKEFFVEFMKGDFGATLFYMLVVISIPQLTTFLWLPVNLFFMIGVCNFFRESKIGFFQRESFVKFSKGVSDNVTNLKRARVYVEFFMIFYFIGMTIAGFYSFIIQIIYFHFIKIKYQTHQLTYNMLNDSKVYQNSFWYRYGMAGKAMNSQINGFFWLLTWGSQASN